MMEDQLKVMVYLALLGHLRDQDWDAHVLTELPVERFFEAIHWLEDQTYCYWMEDWQVWYPSHLGISWAATNAPEEMIKEISFTLAPTGLVNNPMLLFPSGKTQP